MPSRNLDAFRRVGFCLFRIARSRRRLGEKNCDGTNRPAHEALYDNTTARAGVAYSGTYCATAAHQVARGNAAGQKSKIRAGTAAEPMSNLTFIRRPERVRGPLRDRRGRDAQAEAGGDAAEEGGRCAPAFNRREPDGCPAAVSPGGATGGEEGQGAGGEGW